MPPAMLVDRGGHVAYHLAEGLGGTRMKRASLFILGGCAGIGMLLVTPGAWALGPFDVEVAARVGGATSPSTGQASTAGASPNGVVGSNPIVNPLGLGLGARGGVSYSRYPDGPHVASLYGGISFMYYLGGSVPPGGVPYAGYSTAQSLIYGVELGLNVSLSSLTIRPQLGIGDYTLLQGGIAPQDAPHAGPATSNWLYLEPGGDRPVAC
jgi:hypothetical protein